jgi:hypothetical protein
VQVAPIQFIRGLIDPQRILEVEMPELDPGVPEESANGFAAIAGVLKTLLLSNPKRRSRPADRQDARRNNSSSACGCRCCVTLSIKTAARLVLFPHAAVPWDLTPTLNGYVRSTELAKS